MTLTRVVINRAKFDASILTSFRGVKTDRLTDDRIALYSIEKDNGVTIKLGKTLCQRVTLFLEDIRKELQHPN